MISDADLDALMAAYCEGMYAMDPRTTYPFWDYDFAPLLSQAWITKILASTAACSSLRPDDFAYLFNGPSVPRKELIYSLFDLKVAKIERSERLRQVTYWVDLLKGWCGDDWLSSGSNRAESLDRPRDMIAAAQWSPADRTSGLAVGRLTVALNCLAYALYSDVFVHQCAECRGPYQVHSQEAESEEYLLVRSWTGLYPHRLQPQSQDPGFERVVVAAVYDCHLTIDIYNHVSWAEPPVDHIRRYAVWIDGTQRIMKPGELEDLAYYLAGHAERAFRRYEEQGFEEKKRMWVIQRNYQFRRFFRTAGLGEDAPEMEVAVAGKPLHHSMLWNTTLPKEQITEVWRKCLDPRTEIYYDDWDAVFHDIFGGCPRP
jgi:hypothetical protein